MAELHDLEGAGVRVENTIFCLHEGMASGTWKVGNDPVMQDSDPDQELTGDRIAGAMRLQPQDEDAPPLRIYVADDLATRMWKIVNRLEAKVERENHEGLLQGLDGGGVRLDQTTFQIDPGLPHGRWTGVGDSLFIDARGGEQALTIGTAERERDRELPPGITQLVIRAAPDLREKLREVIEGIEADERRERDERDRERMEEVIEPPDPTRVAFSGKVTLEGDEDRPYIEGNDILGNVEGKFAHRLVEVYLGAEREPAITAAGEATADAGWEGTDETSGEIPRIEVGGFDLLGKLRELEGRHVELVVREVERPGPFYIEVDPRLPEETWKVDDFRFGAKPRRDSELTGAKLVELVEANCGSIVVSFQSSGRVEYAMDEYHAIERERRVVLPQIEVVPGKGDAVPRTFELKGRQVGASQFVAGIARMGFGLAGMDTPQELNAAQRALDGHRSGQLVVILDERIANGPWWRAGSWAANDLDQAIAFAREARGAKAEGTEPPADAINAGEQRDSGSEADVVILHEGHEVTVYVDRRLGDGEWTVAEGVDPSHCFTGGFTTDKVRSLIAQHHEVFTVSLDLLPNAIAVLVGIGEVNGNRDVSEWCEEIRAKLANGSSHPATEPAVDLKTERSASELIVFAIREAIREVEANVRAANGEAFPRRGGLGALVQFAPMPTSAALNNAYERLIEALMWADKHEENVAAARRATEGKTAAEIMAAHLKDAGIDLGAIRGK